MHCFFLPANRIALTAFLLGGGLAAAPVGAQQDDGAWRFSLGLGAISQPKYPGSGDRETRALPVFSASYGRLFIGGVPGAGVPAGVGYTLVQQGPWRFGVGLGANFGNPRDESDSPRLAGMGDIDGTALGSVFASYNHPWFAVRGSVVTDIGGNDHGTRGLFDAEARYGVTDRLTLTGGPGLTLADRKHTQTFFGVTAAQSATSALPQTSSSGGLNSVRLNIGANYRITPQWDVSVRATAARLRGDAADSPITEKTSQNSVGLFTAYRF